MDDRSLRWKEQSCWKKKYWKKLKIHVMDLLLLELEWMLIFNNNCIFPYTMKKFLVSPWMLENSIYHWIRHIHGAEHPNHTMIVKYIFQLMVIKVGYNSNSYHFISRYRFNIRTKWSNIYVCLPISVHVFLHHLVFVQRDVQQAYQRLEHIPC